VRGRKTIKIKIGDVLGAVAGAAVLGFSIFVLLGTEVGVLALGAGSLYIVYLIHVKIEEWFGETPAAIYLMFFALPTVLVIGGGGAWLIGCLYGINSCRSPF
jgi:hypothetical protein